MPTSFPCFHADVVASPASMAAGFARVRATLMMLSIDFTGHHWRHGRAVLRHEHHRLAFARPTELHTSRLRVTASRHGLHYKPVTTYASMDVLPTPRRPGTPGLRDEWGFPKNTRRISSITRIFNFSDFSAWALHLCHGRQKEIASLSTPRIGIL